jgi:hypothetical protein
MMQLNQQAKIGQHIVEGNVQTNNQEENDFFFDANNFVDNLRCKQSLRKAGELLLIFLHMFHSF